MIKSVIKEQWRQTVARQLREDTRPPCSRLSSCSPLSTIIVSWEIFFGLSSGPFIEVACMSIRANAWTDALHAARFSCLSFSLYHLEVGWSLCPSVLFPWPIACVYA